jgi:hypothetical protein
MYHSFSIGTKARYALRNRAVRGINDPAATIWNLDILRIQHVHVDFLIRLPSDAVRASRIKLEYLSAEFVSTFSLG